MDVSLELKEEQKYDDFHWLGIVERRVSLAFIHLTHKAARDPRRATLLLEHFSTDSCLQTREASVLVALSVDWASQRRAGRTVPRLPVDVFEGPNIEMTRERVRGKGVRPFAFGCVEQRSA